MEKNKRDVIVVAVEVGPKGSDRRATDYCLPGAIDYMDFFRQELMSLIENHQIKQIKKKQIKKTPILKK